MATTGPIGLPVTCNLERREDDTDDITVHLKDSTGADANVVGWTAQLSISSAADGAPIATFNGTGISGGLIPIDMAAFAVIPGPYKYDIRITDTVTVDNPVRVYFIGNFVVKDRIQ